MTQLQLPQIQTLVFAGGGNRCWWQAAVVGDWMKRGWRLPPTLVGTSAGAAIAAAALTSEGLQHAFEGCRRIFADNPRLLESRTVATHRWQFSHERIYPAWLASFVDDGTYEAVQKAPQRLMVALTRPARALGLGGSVVAGTLAYLVDKFVWNRLHPRLPRMLGLRQEFLDLKQCSTLAEARKLLLAAAAAPPFMPAQEVAGGVAIDGGYLDSVAVPTQDEEARASTLVLLTRHYPRLPVLFRHRERHYMQPSQRVPVSTWDCTAAATIHAAYDLGRLDVAQAMDHHLVTLDKGA
ncbi:patatin-like phospholipase family protein [Dyella solisilvae]|uniref:patatin-like phospholipase family protein n=1 Tax=Dyella solisilvae TaxID=1920168 RepID=UPI0018F5C158|nr:patatin-like phospholipase family protein [Dyella solisilvae]